MECRIGKSSCQTLTCRPHSRRCFFPAALLRVHFVLELLLSGTDYLLICLWQESLCHYFNTFAHRAVVIFFSADAFLVRCAQLRLLWFPLVRNLSINAWSFFSISEIWFILPKPSHSDIFFEDMCHLLENPQTHLHYWMLQKQRRAELKEMYLKIQMLWMRQFIWFCY